MKISILLNKNILCFSRSPDVAVKSGVGASSAASTCTQDYIEVKSSITFKQSKTPIQLLISYTPLYRKIAILFIKCRYSVEPLKPTQRMESNLIIIYFADATLMMKTIWRLTWL